MAVLKLSSGVFNQTTSQSTAVANVDATQTDDGSYKITWEVPNTEDTKTIDTDVGAGGRYQFINRDDTDTISVGWATGVYFTTLKPGEPACGRVPSGTTTIYAVSSANTPLLEVEIYKA